MQTGSRNDESRFIYYLHLNSVFICVKDAFYLKNSLFKKNTRSILLHSNLDDYFFIPRVIVDLSKITYGILAIKKIAILFDKIIFRHINNASEPSFE